MRIIFLLSGHMWKYTLPEGFIEAGHEVELTGPISEESLKNKFLKFKPHLAMSIGWGIDQKPKNQLLMRKLVNSFKIPHIYWSIEDPAYTSTFSLPLIQRMQPDFVFSICSSTVEFFNKLGIKAAYMDFGFSTKIHKKVQCCKNYKSSISIVANAYPNILQLYPDHFRHTSIKTLVIPLLKNNIKIDFWGRNWDKVNSHLNYEIPKEWIHGYLPYKDANKVYCSSDIVIGLQNYTTQLTQRTYEILACSGFLLTSDTPAIRASFEPGKQLITASSPSDTLNLVKYYLNNPLERKKISECGRNHIVNNNNSYKNRAEYMLEVLKKHKII